MADEELKILIQKNIELSEKILVSLEKQRQIRRWTLIITLIVVVLPLIITLISLPWMIQTIQSYYGELLTI